MNAIIFSDYLSVQQIAEQLQVSKQTVRNWIKTGCQGLVLRSYKVAGKRRILQNDLDDFLEAVTHEGFGEVKPDRTPAQQSKGYRDAMKYLANFSKN